MKKIVHGFLCLFLILIPSAAYTANIAPDAAEQAGTIFLSWTLATAQATTGDSDTAINVQFCRGPKTLLITTSPPTGCR